MISKKRQNMAITIMAVLLSILLIQIVTCKIAYKMGKEHQVKDASYNNNPRLVGEQ